MVVYNQGLLEKFGRKHAAARKPIRRWLEVAEAATWKSPDDIKHDDASASLLSKNRVIFNLGGNRYRLLIVAIYAAGQLDIRWIGTHAEYSKLKF